MKATLDEIRAIVASNEKQRFSLIHASTYNSGPEEGPADADTDPAPVNGMLSDSGLGASAAAAASAAEQLSDTDPRNYYIRANQGHSIALAPEDIATMLTPITLEQGNLPAVVVHGTRHDAWAKILASGGLKPMGRMHIHFAAGVPEGLRWTSSHDVAHGSATGANGSPGEGGIESQKVETLPDRAPAPAVLSGMRHSSSILVFVNLRLALEKDIKFYLSENGVVLSGGDTATGMVPMDVFERVEERGGRLLVKDGVKIADANQSEARKDRGGGGRGGRGSKDIVGGSHHVK